MLITFHHRAGSSFILVVARSDADSEPEPLHGETEGGIPQAAEQQAQHDIEQAT
jgi:hypothetical protein